MNILGIIPARMASTRFPGKPLAKILGKAMIYHVYFRSKMTKTLKEVYLATCDKEIENYCLENNINVVMTEDTHQRASDRTAEAMLKIEKQTGERIDIVMMIQGDEPMVTPEMIDLAVQPLRKDSSILVANLMHKLNSGEGQKNPNTIKVVVDKNNYALYFSRQPIPSGEKVKGDVPRHNQVAIIPFRRDFLITFNKLTPTPLEIIESIDMLRILEHGYKIKMVMSEFDTHTVDTPEDLKLVDVLMKNDPLVPQYGRDNKGAEK